MAGGNCAIEYRSGYIRIILSQEHVTKNQPITLLVLLSEDLGL